MSSNTNVATNIHIHATPVIAAAGADHDYAVLLSDDMYLSMSVYMRVLRSRLHWQYRRWHETGLETTLKPLSQIRADVFENKLRTV